MNAGILSPISINDHGHHCAPTETPWTPIRRRSNQRISADNARPRQTKSKAIIYATPELVRGMALVERFGRFACRVCDHGQREVSIEFPELFG